jgi:hypothetical protein
MSGHVLSTLASGGIDSPVFVRLIDVLLPHGGCAVIQVEAYFDESGSHDSAPVLCVAGYIIEKSHAISLTHEWRGVLGARRLPYFRMSECAHGNGPFETLSKSARSQLVLRMIQIIEKYTIQGIAVTVSNDEFKGIIVKPGLIGDAYGFAAHVILAGVRSWISSNPLVSKVAYFFESGHSSQSEANEIMNMLFKNEELRVLYRYAAHAFVDKEDTPAVQAADLLAWQWYTDKRHELEGRPRRKDCARLLNHHHNVVHVNAERLAAISRAFPAGVADWRALLRFHEGDGD